MNRGIVLEPVPAIWERAFVRAAVFLPALNAFRSKFAHDFGSGVRNSGSKWSIYSRLSAANEIGSFASLLEIIYFEGGYIPTIHAYSTYEQQETDRVYF